MATLNILIIEDSPQDRSLLKYILESHFLTRAVINEADSLVRAFPLLDRSPHDCIILDLSLPDSIGKETFSKVYSRYPHIPILVMTHNQDRELALSMIKEGAADYVLKDYTKDEDIYRRILFAIEKHTTSVRLSKDSANSVKKLDSIRAKMAKAHESGQHTAVRELSVETASAVADISRRTFVTLQELSSKFERLSTQQEHTNQVIGDIKVAVFGSGERPSLRAMMELTQHRISKLEGFHEKDEERKSQADLGAAKTEIELKKERLTGRTKVLIALLALIGTLGGSYATYKIATLNPPVKQP